MRKKDLKETRPLVMTYGYAENSSQMVFLGYGQRITVEGCNEVLSKLLPLCSGLKPLKEILVELDGEYEPEFLLELIKILFDYEILIDSREAYWIFHRLSMNPTLYSRELLENDIANLLRRRNFKSYKKGEEIDLPPLSEIGSAFFLFFLFFV